MALRRYSKQSEVQRLPVPALRDTLELFLRSSKPHVSDAEWALTQRVVAEFGAPGGIGEKLQERLELRALNNPDSSWLIKWWARGLLTIASPPTAPFARNEKHPPETALDQMNDAHFGGVESFYQRGELAT